LHNDGNASGQSDGLHDEDGRVQHGLLHGRRMVRYDEAILQPLQRIFHAYDELLHVMIRNAETVRDFHPQLNSC